MDTLHSFRSVALGILAVLTTVGGFTLGRQEVSAQPAPVQIPAIDYSKISGDSPTYLAARYGGQLKLTAAQRKSVQSLLQELLPDYEAYARSLWQAKLDRAKKEDEGTVVETEFDIVPWMPRDPKNTGVRDSKQIAALLTDAQRKALFHLRYDVMNRDNARAMDIAYEPATMKALKLSRRQQNQFAALLSVHKSRLETIIHDNKPHPAGHGPAFTEAQYKFFTYYAIQKLLDPYQRLALEAIVRERLYVKP